MKDPTCQEKMDLAFVIDWPSLPINGNTRTSLTTNTERNWFHPEMYFLAVMDCHDEIHKTLGENPFGRVNIDADLTDDDNEFSYEDQSNLQVDRFLFVVYLALIVLFCRDRVKEGHEFENTHTPHWYIIAGMAL